MKSTFLLILLCSIASLSMGQSLEADLVKMAERLENTDGVALTYLVKAFGRDNNQEVIHSEEGFVKSYKGESLVKVNGIWSLKTKHQLIVVDEQLESIRIVNSSEEDEELIKEFLSTEQLQFDSEKKHNITFVGENEHEKHYEVLGVSPEIEKAEYFISTKTGFLSKLIYYYKETLSPTISIVQITYNKVDFKYLPTTGIFSPNQFVKKQKDGTYKPSTKYNTYHIIQTENEE